MRALKRAIHQGRLQAGTQLPSTRELAADLGVARVTVVRAYEQLVFDGALESRTGAGTFVSGSAEETLDRTQEGFGAGPAQTTYAKRMRAFANTAAAPFRKVENTVVTFQSGVLSVNPRLPATWGRELARAAEYAPQEYPAPQGELRLRTAIAKHLARRRGVLTSPDSIVIVNGSQQALSLISRILVEEGDEVVIENPHYIGMRESLRAHGAALVPVPVDASGLVTARLPLGKPRLICVTPSHQSPCGGIMSLERRRDLLEYASARQAWIYEDDYDGEFRFGRRPLPSLHSMDEHDRVIYTGTFSKVLFPSLRLAYVVVPRTLRDDLVKCKWLHDFGCSTIEQIALANFISTGGFDRHLRFASKALYQRRCKLITGLEKINKGRFHYQDSNAGLHLALWLHDTSREQLARMLAKARELKLGLHSLDALFLGVPDQSGVLLSYGALSPAEIEHGVRLLGLVLDARSEWN